MENALSTVLSAYLCHLFRKSLIFTAVKLLRPENYGFRVQLRYSFDTCEEVLTAGLSVGDANDILIHLVETASVGNFKLFVALG